MSRQDKVSVPVVVDTSLAPNDEGFDFEVNLRLRLDEAVQLEEVELRRPRPNAPTRRELCQLACRIYDARRARDHVLDRNLLGEPGWDMLLALYCLRARREILTVTSLSVAAAVPVTTGLRWQSVLADEGLIERGPSIDGDARRVLVRLTTEGRDLLEKYLTRIYLAGASPIPVHPEVHDD